MVKVLFTLLILASSYLVWEKGGLSKMFLPCAEPLTYRVGAFDQRFNITQAGLVSALSEAEAIWEKPVGKNLFNYVPDQGDLPINLVYDYRQETTSVLEELESTVEEGEAAYRALQSRYESRKAQYEQAESAYETLVKEFNALNAAYQRRVEAWNRGSRTSKSEFNQLEAEKRALEAKVAEIRAMETNLNAMVRDINALVESLNSMARTLNLNVSAYNTIGATRGDTFTGGIYYNSDGKDGIDIYEFSSREKLIRILAHEMGHALGLDHIDDKSAIMYYLNNSDVGAASTGDIAAVKSLCRIK